LSTVVDGCDVLFCAQFVRNRGLLRGRNSLKDSVVYRIDPDLATVTDVIPVGAEPRKPGFADRAIWVSNSGDGTVSRIDVETREVTDTLEVGNRPMTPLAFDGAIWVPSPEDGTVTRIQTR
jgi:YVTN family beta-propeller protein